MKRITHIVGGELGDGKVAVPPELPELRLRGRIWVALADDPTGEPPICYRAQDRARLPRATQLALQGFPSESEARAYVAGAGQPWP